MEKMKTIITAILACLPFMSQAQTTELTCWMVTGIETKLAVEGTILKIPNKVAAVDLRSTKTITLDCSSANPNCLYYTNGATSVAGLPSANVVCDGVCDGLLLTDTASFYCPITFTATDAMLRLTPRRDDGDDTVGYSHPCHETVFLPFDADLVIPADADGPMPDGWLQAASFSGYNTSMLVFTQVDATHLKANTPYLVRFEYGAYGTQILFCGQDKTIAKTERAFVNVEPFCFTGTTLLDDEGSVDFRYHRGQDPYFVHTGDHKLMEPFRCFIVTLVEKENNSTTEGLPSSIAGKSEQVLRYTIIGEESTGIVTHSHRSLPKKHYDLQGRQLAKGNRGKGIYITGGVKVMK